MLLVINRFKDHLTALVSRLLRFLKINGIVILAIKLIS